MGGIDADVRPIFGESEMILYHGSTVEVKNPLIVASDVGRDFGAAFYTTDIKAQTERWAVRRAKFARKNRSTGANAIVSVYDFDENAARTSLRVQNFETASMAWLDMMLQCRTHISYKHGYDIVSGKIADDSVGETVSYVVAGIMPKELAIEKLKFQQINNQIAFCTNASLECLHFVSSYQLEVNA